MSATPTSTATKVVTGELHRVRQGRKKAFAATAPPASERKPARVAVLLALAHKIRRAIDRGEIRDQAEAARQLGLTRARLTQLLDVTGLAPDVQETLLFLEIRGERGSVSERTLREVVRSWSWVEQRRFLRTSSAAALLTDPPRFAAS